MSSAARYPAEVAKPRNTRRPVKLAAVSATITMPTVRTGQVGADNSGTTATSAPMVMATSDPTVDSLVTRPAPATTITAPRPAANQALPWSTATIDNDARKTATAALMLIRTFTSRL